MGFNNDGIHRVIGRLARIRSIEGSFKTKAKIPVGGNIGINKAGATPEKDYPFLVGHGALLCGLYCIESLFS